MPIYVVNWRARGLGGIKILTPGSTISLSPAEADPYLKSGLLRVARPNEESTQPPSATDPTLAAIDLSGMTKAQLAEYARTRLALTLDTAHSKADLLAAIADAAGR